MKEKGPQRIAALYFVLGAAWIVLSDYLVEMVLINGIGALPPYMLPQTLKGLVFVTATTLLLYLVLSRYAKRQRVAFTSMEAALLQTERSLQQRKEALRELHHRVKNNLQLVVSMLRLTQSASESSQNSANVVGGVMRRVQTIALSHEHIYNSEIKSDVQLDSYLHALVYHLHQTDQAGRVRVKTEFDEVVLPIDQAVPCGLALSELISNAFQHGFGTQADGELTVSAVRRSGNSLEIRVGDDGTGLPETFEQTNHEGLGLQLVTALVSQLSGQFEIRPVTDGAPGAQGTEALFSFPLGAGHGAGETQ